METIRKICLGASAAALVACAAGLALRSAAVWQPAAVLGFMALSVSLGAVPALRGYQFTAWIIAAVMAGTVYPSLFVMFGPGTRARPGNPWIIPLLVQLVMFGVGTQMSLRDFAGVLKMPWAVLVGVLGQFTIMPLVGFAITKLFSFPEEIAAGIILIGSSSSGLASNVMVYLARANLALSITLTAITTLIAPVMTPFWMKLLAGELVADLQFSKMMLDIIQLVIVPIGAAMLHDFLKHALPRTRLVVHVAAAIGAAWLLWRALATLGWLPGSSPDVALPIIVIGLISAALVAGTIYHALARRFPALEGWMPLASMCGIISYTAISTAAGRDHLLEVGGLLFLAAAMHNTFGYLLGYWLSRALGLDRTSARTVAFEVGLQNGGMATGLASKMGRLATMGLAAIVFSPWMNISGSILANYWRRRPVEVEPSPSE
jgi:BASS family bile acid:Na+ symporter